MNRRNFILNGGKLAISVHFFSPLLLAEKQKNRVAVEQITSSPLHHFFEYIWQSLTIPWNKSDTNFYTILKFKISEWVKTPSFRRGVHKKDLRIDPAPRWDHDNNQILISGLDENGIRQLFIMSINPN
ncbi:MAG: hypothetical protein HN443_05815 [Flavobacteriaceae bacterium]|nr:hypothetical protein [Flavobacteriaceae bacterium]